MYISLSLALSLSLYIHIYMYRPSGGTGRASERLHIVIIVVVVVDIISSISSINIISIISVSITTSSFNSDRLGKGAFYLLPWAVPRKCSSIS